MIKSSATTHKLWKKVLSVFLAIIIGFGTFVTITVSNLLLSDKIDFHNLIIAEAATLNVKYYRYYELVGLYKTDYTNTENIQYKIGESGEWIDYSVPFSIPAFQTTRIYSRIGDNGAITYEDLSTTDKALGVYTETNTDFDFSYNDVTFEYLRSYNSADENWFDSIDSYVSISGNFAQVIMPDNTIYNFIKTADDTFIDELYGYTLEKQSNKYVLLLNNYYYTFSLSSGKYYLSEIKNIFDNKLELNRETTLADFTISDQTDRSFSMEDYYEFGDDFSYNRDITDPNGNILNYYMTGDTWDYITVTDQAGVYLGQYEYTDGKLTKSNNKSIEYYDNGRLKKITYDNGSWIQYTYNDGLKNFTTLTSSGETTKTVYNDSFYPIEYTDELGDTTTYTYDDHFRVLKETRSTEITTYTYDSKGNILSYITDDTESNTYFTYDSNNQILREQTGNSYTYYTYDCNGNNLVHATLKENYTGETPAQYDANLNCFDTTTYTYDSKGRVTSEAYSTGGSVSYEYDNRGNITKEKTVTIEDSENQIKIVTYTYDAFDNLLTSSTGNDTSSYTYDAAGRTLLANENSECTRTIYDNQGRVVQKIDPEDYDKTKDGLPTANTYADANAGCRYVYNETTGNLDSETNRLGVETTYTYYSTGEKKTEAFDIYKYDYNIKGDLTKVYIDGVNTLSYNYDEDYNLTSEVYANGQSIRYEYDDKGNCIRQYHNDDKTPYVTYSYNTDNELTQKINSDTELKYVYGENNKVDVFKTSDNTPVQSYTETETEENEETGAEAYTTVTENHFGTNYSYVTQGKNLTYTSDTNTVQYSYQTNGEDEDEKVTSDSVKYNGNTSVSSAYAYDDNGNVTKKSLSYGDTSLSLVNEYDDKNRITAMGYESVGEYFTYDENDQIARVDNNIASEISYTSTYNYDSRGNVVSKKVYDYTRNSLENAVAKETTSFVYANYGWKDLLVAVNGVELTYDENGNVLTYGDREYNWNTGRHLESITDGDNEYSYTYDENGIRTSKTVNGVTTYYNTKDGVILSQSDGTNTMYFQYDTNGVPLGFVYNGTQYLHMTNQMGDVISITDAQGKELVQYEYDEWGKTISVYLTEANNSEHNALADINPIRYRGYYYDTETGYYYLQSRYYDPSICRFINADDINFVDINTVCGLNIFAYCCNNPVSNADYNGYWGRPVHSGYKSKGYYYSVVSKGKRYYYGTYYWAYRGCGFKENDAKTLANYCFDLDKYYSSSKYFDALYTNDYYRRNGLRPIYSQKQLNTFKSWQYYHFNGYAKGSADTRRTYANNQKNIAVQNWKKNRNYALKMLGYGLHAIQDISAHGQIGRGTNMPQHIFLAPNNKSLFKQADTVQGYIWKNSSRNGLKAFKGSVSRLLEAQRDTYNYLNSFIKSIGGKNRLK